MNKFGWRAPLAAFLVLTCWTTAGAVGVPAKKLVIIDKTALVGKAKVVFVSKLDGGITKGAEGDPSQLSATFSVGYGDNSSVLGSFTLPGGGWIVNKSTVAKYVNLPAPTGGGVKVGVVKPGKVAKVVAHSLGDSPAIDLSAGAPSDAGGIVAIITVQNGNDGSTHEMCAKFSTDLGSSVSYKQIAGGAGYKLVAKNGVPCPTDPCENLNAAECLLPYPSSHFLVDDGSTATGVRVNLPAQGMPAVTGPAVLPDPYNELDGFSPLGPVLMHFPQGVDLELSDAARLLAPGCCGQPAGPPWVDTRTYTDRSLDSDSPSLLIDADTGEHVLHWLEVDGRAQGGDIPGRQALFLRPGISLTPGHRYIVAMRNLKTPGGADVVAEAPFAALRDGTPTADPTIEARRAYMESQVFSVLTDLGIDRASLVLAFDFTVQSDSQLTRQLLSMRDQAFDWLQTVEDTPGLETFTVDTVDTNDCNVAGTVIWKHIAGTFESPLFLDGQPVQTGVQFLNVDANDMPVQNGFMNAPYDITIPCSIMDNGIPNRPIVLGHGIFGTGEQMALYVPPLKAQWEDWNYIAGATDWIGLSARRDTSGDDLWILGNIIGVPNNKFNNFPAFVDRLRQGVLNTLVLGKMMKLGLFNRNTAFDHPLGGGGVFPGPSEDMYYYGISLGGIYGTLFSALTPDVERFGLDVPAISFGCLLQRSTQFSAFDALIQAVGVTDPMQNAILISLLNELWVSAEPAGYATHITTDRLPGSGNPAKILYDQSWLDLQVSNQCTETAVRTLGIPNLVGSLQSGLADIPDVAGPVASANVTWDSGAFDIFNPLHQPYIPPLSNIIPPQTCDPHNGPRQIPAAVHQLLAFLQPGGMITNTCDGTCDATDPSEIPTGGRCDSSSPPMLQGANCEDDGGCGGGVCDPEVWCDPLNP
jgi:hypothetical protein